MSIMLSKIFFIHAIVTETIDTKDKGCGPVCRKNTLRDKMNLVELLELHVLPLPFLAAQHIQTIPQPLLQKRYHILVNLGLILRF